MDRKIRIQEAQVNHKLFSFLYDLLVLCGTTVILYFIILYSVFGLFFNHVSNSNKINEIENTYNLNLEQGLDYSEYEKVLIDFYFVKYPEEIKNQFNDYYSKDYSITHVYNVVVCKLNDEPSFDNYKTDYFSYIQDDSGKFNPDLLAIKVEGSGKVYEKNMSDLFYGSYSRLKDLLETYNEEYRTLVVKDFNQKAISRGVAFGISLVVFYLIIPLTNKNGATLFEKKYKLAHVNAKDGYLVKKHKIILRPFVYYLIPFISLLVWTKNSMIIVLLGYLFINCLLLIFSKNNLDLSERFLYMTTCSVEESLLFENEKDEIAYFNSAEGKKIEDPDYLNKLSGAKEIKLVTSRDEELKK